MNYSSYSFGISHDAETCHLDGVDCALVSWRPIGLVICTPSSRCCPDRLLSEGLGLFMLQMHIGSGPYLLKAPHFARDTPYLPLPGVFGIQR